MTTHLGIKSHPHGRAKQRPQTPETRGSLHPTIRATKQKVKVLSALQFEEFEKVTKEKANNQGSFKITKGPQLTTSPSRATSYERERLAQHKGATHCRKRADKKRRPSRFKKGFAHCRSKKGV
ncbi:hypothetical protein V6N13_118040 [Hibiscus sabdariffa]